LKIRLANVYIQEEMKSLALIGVLLFLFACSDKVSEDR